VYAATVGADGFKNTRDGYLYCVGEQARVLPNVAVSLNDAAVPPAGGTKLVVGYACIARMQVRRNERAAFCCLFPRVMVSGPTENP
jgi:hypothetical protein